MRQWEDIVTKTEQGQHRENSPYPPVPIYTVRDRASQLTALRFSPRYRPISYDVARFRPVRHLPVYMGTAYQ